MSDALDEDVKKLQVRLDSLKGLDPGPKAPQETSLEERVTALEKGLDNLRFSHENTKAVLKALLEHTGYEIMEGVN